MTKKNKTLFLFTDSYPFGFGETYLANEIWEYYPHFKKIVFIPINLQGEKRAVPSNCEVFNLHKEATFGFLSFICSIPFVCKTFSYEWKNTRHKTEYLRNFLSSIKKLFNAFVYAKALKEVLKKEQETVIFYSYWFYHWALVCATAKERGYINWYYARAHLGDLYEMNSKVNFTNFKLQHIKKLFVISNHGKEYFVQNYPIYLLKIEKHYLGTPLPNNMKQYKERLSDYTIVSCSSVRPAKKVDKIFQVVNELNFPIKWIHFGSGPLFEDLKALVLNKKKNHIEIELRGHVTNSELLKFYATHHVDLFINLSDEEGLPVSIMEAQSFGIPVLATDVYATNEAVVEGTGVLVKTDDDVFLIAKKIDELNVNLANGRISPAKIIEHWKLNFNAEKNYREMTNILINAN